MFLLPYPQGGLPPVSDVNRGFIAVPCSQGQPLDPNLSHMNPIHTRTHAFYKIYFNTTRVFPTIPGPSKWSLPCRLPNTISVLIYYPYYACYMLSPYHLPRCDRRSNDSYLRYAKRLMSGLWLCRLWHCVVWKICTNISGEHTVHFQGWCSRCH